MADVSMSNIESCVITVEGIADSAGQLISGAVLDASPVPTWTPEPNTYVSVTPAGDGMSCKIKALGPPTPPGGFHMFCSGFYNGGTISGEFVVEIHNSSPAAIKLHFDSPTVP